MKDKMTALSATNPNVIGEALTDVSSDILAYLPKKTSLQRFLRMYRNAEPVPRLANFDISEVYSQFILHDSGANDSNRILVLGDKDVSRKLHADTLFGDGTFDKVPSMLYQLYTWHAQVGNSYIPCVYVLLQRKDQITYEKMFDILKLLVPDLNPTQILLDLEKASMKAAMTSTSTSWYKGLLFWYMPKFIEEGRFCWAKARV